MREQEYSKAYEAYQQAVYWRGRHPTAWTSIAILYFKIGQYEDSLDALHRSASQAHIYHRAATLNWFNLGILVGLCIITARLSDFTKTITV